MQHVQRAIYNHANRYEIPSVALQLNPELKERNSSRKYMYLLMSLQ